MKRSLYQFGDLVFYLGRLWRVAGFCQGGIYLRVPGWEYGQGWWGWDGYGNPIRVATIVNPASSLLYHA